MRAEEGRDVVPAGPSQSKKLSHPDEVAVREPGRRPRSDGGDGGDGDDGCVGDARADFRWMGLALDEARRAADRGEVPVGAVVVRAGEVLAHAHNLTRARGDPTAHAEMLAISEAARRSGYERLLDASVYCTVEPCFMCAGALVHARVARVVWGVRDPKFGGCASLGNVLDDPRLNHRVRQAEGVRADEARELLQAFFRRLRAAGDTA